MTTQEWPKMMQCSCSPLTNLTMVIMKHEPMPIAERVKRSYQCQACGQWHTWFFDVGTHEIVGDRAGDW